MTLAEALNFIQTTADAASWTRSLGWTILCIPPGAYNESLFARSKTLTQAADDSQSQLDGWTNALEHDGEESAP